MEDVLKYFAEKTADRQDIACVVQSQYMNEEEREAFLQTFETDREETLIGFCVMGGIFSEGIDLSRDRLIGQLPDRWTRRSIFSSRSVLQKRKASNKFLRMKFARLGKLTPGDNNEARLFQNGGGCGRCRFPVPAGAGSKFFQQRQREERNSGGRADRQSSV